MKRVANPGKVWRAAFGVAGLTVLVGATAAPADSPIDSCDWTLIFDGSSPSIGITSQLRRRRCAEREHHLLRIGDDCATGVLERTTNAVQTVVKCTTPIFTP